MWGDQADGGYTDEEEEEQEEENGKGNALDGFMFGNVDKNLRLEENYLDQEAIDKLGELGAKLGGELNLLQKKLASEKLADEEDGDYDVAKAENAVDFEDEQEVIEETDAGRSALPDVQLAPPFLPGKQPGVAPEAEEDDYDEDGGAEGLTVSAPVSTRVVLGAPEEEDYNEEEGTDLQAPKSADALGASKAAPEEEDYDEDWGGAAEQPKPQGLEVLVVEPERPGMEEDLMEEDKKALEMPEGEPEEAGPLELPVLFQRAGAEPVLRFSELFGKQAERPKKRLKKKASKKKVQIEVPVESIENEESDDDEAWFHSAPQMALKTDQSQDLARQASGEGFRVLGARGSASWRVRRAVESEESEEERGPSEPDEDASESEADASASSAEEGLTTEEEEPLRSAPDVIGFQVLEPEAPGGGSAEKREGLAEGLAEGLGERFSLARDMMEVDAERRASHRAASTSADVSAHQGPKGRRRRAFRGGQPVRAENGEVLQGLRDSLPEENFALVHQVEWERSIIWNGDGALGGRKVGHRRGGVGGRENGGHDVLENGVNGRRLPVSANRTLSEEEESELTSFSVGDTGNGGSVTSAEHGPLPPAVIETLSKDEVMSRRNDVSESAYPQMLRLERRQPPAEGPVNEKVVAAHELLKRMMRLDLGPGDWLPDAGLDNRGRRAKLVLDLNDPHMVFEIKEGDKEGLRVKAHASAMVLTAQGKERPPSATAVGGENQQAAAAPQPGAAVRFNVSNDRFYQTTQVKKTKARQRAQESRVKVVHAVPAIKLQTSRPTPLLKEMANFHRPRAVWFPVFKDRVFEQENSDRSQIRLVVKALGSIGKSVTVRVKGTEALEAVRAKVMSKWKDVKKENLRFLHAGKEITDGPPLTDQSLRHDSIVHLIRTQVYPLLKANKLPKPDQPSKPPGAFKKKTDLTAKEGHVLLMEYSEERPPLLSLPGMGARLATYYRKRSSADGNAASLKTSGGFLGQIVPLEPAEPTPFLGQVPEGQSVTSLETSLYRAPAFRHKVPTTDFLLVRSNHGKLSLRKVTGLHLVGQEEPSKEVMVPNSKAALKYSEARLQLHVFREFTAQLRKKKGNEHASLPMYDLARQFPGQAEQTLRKWLRPFAQFTTLGMLMKKPGFMVPQEDELRRMVVPEQVCMFEAMKAGQEYLRRGGISLLTTPVGIPQALEQLVGDPQTKDLAEFIHRELQLTPWNLTASFLTGMEGRGQMELTGLADPTGRGQGFSYLRLPAKKEEDEMGKKKKALLKEKEGKLTGTDADLRRLSMQASKQMLLNFGVRESEIPKNRWRRIEMVRKFSSAAALEGRAGAAANKFARGSRLTLMQQQEIFMKKAQEIWDAQLKALADEKVPEEAGSDGEGSDMDSFAKELEAALEEGDKDEEVAKKRDVRGFGRARQALQARVREEQLEDEEAEAEELRKMLQEDDEQVQGKREAAEDKGEVEPDVPEPPEAPAAPAREYPRVVKVVRVRKVDGKEIRVEELLKDPEKIAEFYRDKEKRVAAGGWNKAPPAPKPGVKKKVQRTGLVEDEDEGLVERSKKRKTPLKGGNVSGKKGGRKGALTVQTVGLKKADKGKGETPTPKTGKGTDRVCLKCGQTGHMSTNRLCPLYNEDGGEAAPRQVVQLFNEAVRVEGTKVAISRKKQPAAAGTFGGLTPKLIEPPKRQLSTVVSLKRPRKSGEGSADTEHKPKKLKGNISFVCKAEGGEEGGKRPAEGAQTHPPKKKQKVQNKKLNALLGRIMKRLGESPLATEFYNPVTDAIAPGYSQIIERPMCIKDIMEKLRTFQYDSLEGLVADVELMRQNAHTYNHPGIPQAANQLFDVFLKELEAKKIELAAAANQGAQ